MPAERVGRPILVKTAAASASASGVAVYARVVCHDQRADLDRQVARLTAWASAQGLPVGLGAPPACGAVVCEVGSGLNGQ